jgi:Mn-containing catalase
MPIPGSFPQNEENQEFNYDFMSTFCDEHENPEQLWTQGESPDGKGEFGYRPSQPGGGAPDLEGVIEEMHNEVN